jgi:O-methyltransferase
VIESGNIVTIKFDAPAYCPYFADTTFVRYSSEIDGFTAVPVECRWTLYQMARQCRKVAGDFFECGVDRGGSARFIANVMHGSGKTLHLFDTFGGMPASDRSVDYHQEGDFPEVPAEQVAAFVGYESEVVIHKGLIPHTFDGMEDARIAFAHVDVDIYESTKACCEFIYPRLSRGGVIVFDDYARPTCQGARVAIDEYFADKDSFPLMSLTAAQAVVFKS